ncbi:eukaryotic translation initiation factor 2-alpha kinase 4, partial [Tremellales sp. Uapishka_1]
MFEHNKTIQEEELEALRAIFPDEWHDIAPKKTAWGTEGESGWWEIRIKAQDARVAVGLRGRMIKSYPDTPPPLILTDPEKLSNIHIQTLSRLMGEWAKGAVGGPMIFDVRRLRSLPTPTDIHSQLIDRIREWIEYNHLPLPRLGAEVPTLMEEMAQREEAQRALEAANSHAELQEKMAIAAEQNRLLTEKIQLDTFRKEERARQAMLDQVERARLESIAGLTDGELELRELVLEEEVSVAGYDGSWRNWILFGGRREALWTSYTAEPVTGEDFIKAILPTLDVQVIDFSQSYYSTQQGVKKIEAIAAEINRLKELNSENVVRVIAVKREKSPKGWERLVVVVERFVEGARLGNWIPRDGMGEEVAKDYLTQILSGLSELHKKGISQKQVDPDLVLVACETGGDQVLKITGTSYARRIIELHRSNPFLRNYDENVPVSWLSPDEVDSPYSHSPKRDIWHVGMLLVQMLFGVQSLWRYPNLQTLLHHGKLNRFCRYCFLTGNALAPLSLSEQMLDILSGLLNPSYKKRLSADDAIAKLRIQDEASHRTVGLPFGEEKSFLSRNASSDSSPGNSMSGSHGLSSPQDQFGRSPVFGRGLASYFPSSATHQAAPLLSRYRTDFEEVEFLGKGGFGEVVKARNRLDGRSYAIKKVKLRPEDNEQKVYREVNSLSRVSHQYIVRYYGCWLEDTGRPDAVGSLEDTTTPNTAIPNTSSSDEDIFATNFDDLSRREHSRSASFPRIRFANSNEDDDDSSDDDSSDTEDSASEGGETAADPSDLRAGGRARVLTIANMKEVPKNSQSYTDNTTDDGMVQRILYIQMEFVEKQTLREAITYGLSEEDSWRLLLQILQALAHMSSLGIVHRDASGNVKIADFGLSTTDMTTLESSVSSLRDSADLSDRTSGIGTSLYIAPEVAISRSYNEKADMYSLGVIFFEMCYPLQTSMERAQVLTALRLPSTRFPPGWPVTEKPNQREVVAWLMRHDPTMRPQATQLLASPLLPSPEKQKEFYDAAIAELTNPKSTQYPSLVDALFNAPSRAFTTSLDSRLDDYTYENDYDDEFQVWLTVVTRRLVDLFQRHGAVEDYVPLLIPETDLLKAFPDITPVRLLDTGGKIVQLPSSDLLTMARSVTRRQIERIKRYHVGKRYADHLAGGQPRVSGELIFEVVSPLRYLAADAELLEVVDKVISELRGAKGSTFDDFDFHVSHESVLAVILGSLPEKSRSHILKAFKAIESGVGFSQSRALLSGAPGLPKQQLEELELLSTTDDIDAVKNKLGTLFPASNEQLAVAIEEIETIVKLARAFGVERRILFRPTLAKNVEFFRGGFMFQCVRRGKQRDVVAFGGRYDSLLDHFRDPARSLQSRKVYGVGLSIAVDQLARMVRRHESSLSSRLMMKDNEDERSFGYWSPARCDVYVASVAQVDLSTRLSVVGELWRAGIRADLQYDDERNVDDVLLECLEQNTLFLVIPRANRPIFKIRNILKRSEDEVPRSELCNWLRMATAEQRRIDAGYASAEGSIPSVTAAALSVDPRAPELDIRIVLQPDNLVSTKQMKVKPVRKHRRNTKHLFYDKGISPTDFAASVKTTLPIYGIDLPSSLLSQMALDTAWLNEDDSWRTFLSGVPIPDRKYADLVRETISNERGKLGGFVWLFGLRELKVGLHVQLHGIM